MTTIGPFESCAQLVVWACCGLAWALSFISDRAVAPAALVAGAVVEVARWLDQLTRRSPSPVEPGGTS